MLWLLQQIMKVIIARLFQAYDITPVPGHKPEAIRTVARWPQDEIPCVITARK